MKLIPILIASTLTACTNGVADGTDLFPPLGSQEEQTGSCPPCAHPPPGMTQCTCAVATPPGNQCPAVFDYAVGYYVAPNTSLVVDTGLLDNGGCAGNYIPSLKLGNTGGDDKCLPYVSTINHHWMVQMITRGNSPLECDLSFIPNIGAYVEWQSSSVAGQGLVSRKIPITVPVGDTYTTMLGWDGALGVGLGVVGTHTDGTNVYADATGGPSTGTIAYTITWMRPTDPIGQTPMVETPVNAPSAPLASGAELYCGFSKIESSVFSIGGWPLPAPVLSGGNSGNLAWANCTTSTP